ncbi:MAG: ABC transporter ATP-binding protein [Dehalococcoidia bacterium]|nr:ABC transporter ATP-binding protein [Dehalococcoidia bacterium]
MTTSPPVGYGHIGGSALDDQVLGKLYDHRVVIRLMRYVLRYRLWASLSLIGMAGYIVTIVVQPLIIAWGINGFIVQEDGAGPGWGSLNVVALVFLVNTVANIVFNYVQYYALARMNAQVLYDLRTEMFDHLQKQSTSFYDRSEVGRIMSRVQNDVLQLQEFMGVAVITAGDVGLLVFIGAAMLWMSPVLGIVTLATTPLLVIVMAFWQQKSRPTFVRVRTAISSVNGSLQENISGIRVAQAMNRQAVNLERFDGLNGEHMAAQLRASWLGAALLPAVEMTTVAALGLVVIIGGGMVLSGALGVGFLVAFLLYVQRFFEPIRTITIQYTAFQRAMASGARIFELLDIRPQMEDAPGAMDLPTIEGDIRFENVSFEYVPDVEVIHDLGLHVEPGQTVAFVGLTGAGKTTIVSLITRFYDVTKGRITIDGHDVRDVRRESIARQTSMVLQEPFLYSISVKDNIRYRHEEVSDNDIVRAAKIVGAHDFITALEDGYDTILQQRGTNLSMGQRQLISFARAVVADPRILILDEATANIDSHTERLIQDGLDRVLRGRTSIVIAHRLSTIIKADRIVVLDLGRVVESGNHQELLAAGGRYANLYAMNFGETLEGTGGDLSAEREGTEMLEEIATDWGGGGGTGGG